jgi:hypothetical protein
MRLELKTIGIWSFIKVSFFFSLIFGFIFGFLYAIFAGLVLTVMGGLPYLPADEYGGGDISMGFLIIAMPIIMGIGGAIMNTILGLIAVAVYNLIARLVGGLEFSFDPVSASTSTASLQPVRPQAAFTERPAPPPPPPGDPGPGGPEG